MAIYYYIQIFLIYLILETLGKLLIFCQIYCIIFDNALCTRFLLRVSREIMRKYGRKSVDFIRRFHLGNFSARALPLGMLHFQLITTGAYIEFSHLFFINYFKQMMKYKNMFINLCNSFIKPQKLDINSGMIFRNSPSK